MDEFTINGIKWRLQFVSPNSPMLYRSDGSRTVGMTDRNTSTVYLSDALTGAFLERVICHELCHCFCFSYDIHLDIEQEEYLAEWVSLYGRKVIELLDKIMNRK